MYITWLAIGNSWCRFSLIRNFVATWSVSWYLYMRAQDTLSFLLFQFCSRANCYSRLFSLFWMRFGYFFARNVNIANWDEPLSSYSSTYATYFLVTTFNTQSSLIVWLSFLKYSMMSFLRDLPGVSCICFDCCEPICVPCFLVDSVDLFWFYYDYTFLKTASIPNIPNICRTNSFILVHHALSMLKCFNPFFSS